MYPLTQDPNLQRTNTSFVIPTVDWGKELALLSQYTQYAYRNSPNKPKSNDQLKDISKWVPSADVVTAEAQKKLLDEHQKILDYAKDQIIKYNYELPLDVEIEINQKNNALLQHQAQLVATEKAYREYEKFAKDPNMVGKLDLDFFSEQAKKYAAGEPVFEFVQFLPMDDPKSHLAGILKERGEKYTETKEEDVDGSPYKVTYSSYSNITEPELQKIIRDEYKRNVGFRPAIDKAFNELPEETRSQFESPVEWAVQDRGFLDLLKPKVTSRAQKEAEKEGMTYTERKQAEKMTVNKIGDAWRPKEKIPYDYTVNTYYVKDSSGKLEKHAGENLLIKNADVIEIQIINGIPMALITGGKASFQLLEPRPGEDQNATMLRSIMEYESSGDQVYFVPFSEVGETLKKKGYRFENSGELFNPGTTNIELKD